MSIKKEYVFLAIVLLSAVFVAFKTYRPDVKLSIKAMVLAQDKSVKSIYQSRSTKSTKTLYLDTLAFPSGNELSHALYGKLNFKNNFFIDVSSDMMINKDGKYYFDVYSDDGFVLNIDDNRVCEFIKDRAYKKTSCATRLNRGKHSINLSYFQGVGSLGLTVFYSSPGDLKWHTLGEDSDNITFKRVF